MMASAIAGRIMLSMLEWNDDGLAVRRRHFHLINDERLVGHDRFIARRRNARASSPRISSDPLPRIT